MERAVLPDGANSVFSLSNVTFKEWSLPDGIRDDDFIGGDVLVHCAIVPYSRKQPDADGSTSAAQRSCRRSQAGLLEICVPSRRLCAR